MGSDDGACCGKAGILCISIVALVVTLCNAGVWVACAVEYCEIYDQTDIKGEWEIAILWYTPPVVALVLMFVPSIFGICMGTMCYDSAVGIAIAVFSTLSVIGTFAYVCLELLALFGDKEDIYYEIFNRVLITESDTGEWMWRVQLGLTCLMLLITMCLIVVGYCSCSMVDEDEIDHAKAGEEGFPNDPGYGQFDDYKPPYMISKTTPSNSRNHNDYGFQNGNSVNRRNVYNDDLIADHLRPRPQPTHVPHQDPWSRQPTFTSRQEQHAESMESKYARYGAQPAVGPPISRSSSTRRSQELLSRRDEPAPYGGMDPGPPQEPYIVDGLEPLYPSNQRQRRPKQQRNANASILDYGKTRSNYTGIRDMRSQMTNGLPRPQVDYDYGQDNQGLSTRYDYY